MFRRLEDLVLDGRAALGLRAVTPLEQLETQIERLEGKLDGAEASERTGLERALAALEDQAALLRSER